MQEIYFIIRHYFTLQGQEDIPCSVLLRRVPSPAMAINNIWRYSAWDGTATLDRVLACYFWIQEEDNITGN